MSIEIYMVRRLFMAFSLVYLHDYPFMQLWLNIGWSIVHAVYVMMLVPFTDKIGNIIESYNEITFMVVSTFAFGFADIITDIDAKDKLGNFLIWIIALMIGINFIIWIRLVIYKLIELARLIRN
jgi:hypothetical protein